MTADLLSRHLRDLPAFRALLRATEARFYATIDLPQPTLDVGCGDGHFAATTFRNKIAVGIDPQWQSLHEASLRNGYCGLTQAAGDRLPFTNAAFASAISNSVLEHIPDVQSVLNEVSRLLLRGAPFVFCVPSDNFLAMLSVSRTLRAWGLPAIAVAYENFFNRISRHHHCDSPAIWQARLASAGFAVERHWYYFSEGALRALEWGHFLGLPALVTKILFGRWVLVPTPANLKLTDYLLRRHFEEPLPARGAYLFFIARKM